MTIDDVDRVNLLRLVLNKYLPKPKEVTKKNLITGEEEIVIQADKVRY